MKAIAFIPELRLDKICLRKHRLARGLFFLPANNTVVNSFKRKIEAQGFVLPEGSFLLFEGDITGEETCYKIFQAYCLGLMFFYPVGHVSCRAVQDIENEGNIELYIDEYDKFRYMQEDIITVMTRDFRRISVVYEKVMSQFGNKVFNPLSNALEFYQLFLDESKIKIRLLYLSICLESLLLDSDKEGIAYKLSLRCSKLIAAFFKEINKTELYNEVKNSYNLRSTIVHGSDYNKSSDKILKKKGGNATELDHVFSLEKVVRAVMSLMFLHQDLFTASSKGNLGSFIDDNYILD
jgi:hypothetical protein